MAGTEEAPPRGSLEFLDSAVLDTIIPFATELDIEDALKGSVERIDGGKTSPLAAIPQRHAVYLDESINVYVVLQTPYFDERSLRSYLNRLVINLEVQVVNAQTQSGEPFSSAGYETIFGGTAHDSEDPLIVVQGPDENEKDSEGHILVVWRMSVFISRPRLRLQNPSVVFSATANLKHMEHVQPAALKEEYLPNQAPSGMNLLESLGDDPALNGIRPRLSALRVSRVTPSTPTARDLLRPIKNVSRQSIKLYPALNARVRYTRPNSTPSKACIVASLEIDVTQFVGCEVTIKDVQLQIIGGEVKDLNKIAGLELPLDCRPLDDVRFLYSLFPDAVDVTNVSPIRTLDISVTATANLSAICRAQIAMRWTTTIDFTPPVNPGFGQATQPIVRAHRPAQLSLGSTLDMIPASSVAISGPDSLPASQPTASYQRHSSIPDFGVTMSFIGPDPSTPIYPGEPFVWSVFVVNRSDRSRKLAVIVLPKRRRTEARITRPPSTGYGNIKKDPKIADAVLDDNIIHAMHRNSAIEATEIICLTTDARIGPLAPAACNEVELKFIALTTGLLSVEAVRVVDLGTQEHVDIKDLPSIVVTPLP